jgi:hypothetical protein
VTLFGSGHASVTSGHSRVVVVTIRPDSAAKKALRSDLVARRILTVTATLSYQSSLGGPSDIRTFTIHDSLPVTHRGPKH